MENTNVASVAQDSRNMVLLIWILTLFFGFIPSLIFYLVKKDDAYVQDQAKEALNWSITVLIASIAGAMLLFILVGALIMFAVGLAHSVFCIMGVIGTSGGKEFRVPFALRLIK